MTELRNQLTYCEKGQAPPIHESEWPFFYICATMWHENEEEMRQLVDSIIRLDIDQNTRSQKLHSGSEREYKGYYEFEAHVFFDDAFANSEHGSVEVNDFVNQLIDIINIAMRTKAKNMFQHSGPQASSTPYGGRLTWALPGDNTLIVHLKDKRKIRHTKRWSQLMYMYYFLFKSSDLVHNRDVLNMDADKQPHRNTFLLALDGDVDFQPESLLALLKCLQRDKNIGAVCGRLHPLGSGPIVWYQKFEYAVSHWLQKTSEHVLGCVLCSPGCFSLYRAVALMDKNIILPFSEPPNSASEFIQHDLGEDRWLTTLFLKAGYRVEYCGDAHAKTVVPERFGEFLKQRRRWSPSSYSANLLTVGVDRPDLIRNNGDISIPFIAFVFLELVVNLLHPGLTFLALVWSSVSLYPDMSLAPMIYGYSVLLVIYAVFIRFASIRIQIFYSGVLTCLFTLLMLVAGTRVVLDSGPCSLVVVFISSLFLLFLVSSLLHPKEVFCLIHLATFLVLSPALRMIVSIFALGNLHLVSWGTRETAPQQNTSHLSCSTHIKEKLSNDSNPSVFVQLDRRNMKIEFDHRDEKSLKEEPFWREVIEKHLRPLNQNTGQQIKIQKDLIRLRNICCLVLLLINTLFVALVLNVYMENFGHNLTININLPCSDKYVMLKTEIWTLILIGLFAGPLMLQFLCMVCRRLRAFVTYAFDLCNNFLTKLEEGLRLADKHERLKDTSRLHEPLEKTIPAKWRMHGASYQ